MGAPEKAYAGRVIFAVLFGSVVEFYDFFIFASAAALIFGPLFFPSDDRLASLLASIAAFGVAYIARPLGGMIFGSLGDRRGRKFAFVTTMILMGAATFAIGLLPDYSSIGILAPILLVSLRFTQGISIGGEWGGAVLFAIENAPKGKRTLYGAIPQYGSPIGLLLSTAILAAMSSLTGQQFLSWGWRVPFLLSALLVAVALITRLKLTETPEFLAALEARGTRRSTPLASALRDHPGSILKAIGLVSITIGGFYMITTFMMIYGTQILGFQRSDVLFGQIIVALVEAALIAGAIWMTSYVRRRSIAILGAMISCAWAFPLFVVPMRENVWSLWLAMIIGIAGISLVFAVVPGIVSAMFPVSVRYSAISISYQTGAMLSGGLMPLVATTLLKTGSYAYLGPSAIMLVVSAIALVSSLLITDANDDQRDEVDRMGGGAEVEA